MKRSWLYPVVFLMAVAVAGLVVLHAGEISDQGVAVEDPAVSCAAAPAAPPAEEVAQGPKPRPEPGPLCLVEICKLRNNGQLVYCIANVTDTCCEYKTNDCTAVSSCPAGVGIYCNGSNPGGFPPNACGGTCN